MDHVKDSQRYFGERVADYRESVSHARGAELDRMVALLRPQPGMVAVDVATGGGHTARALRRAGCRVIATDVARPMLEALDAGEEGEGVQADAARLPIATSRVDVVASRIAPHHFADLPAFAREAARVLRPGGRLYVFDLTSPEGRRSAEVVDRMERLRDPSHVCNHSPSAWREALEEARLEVERLDRTHSEFDAEAWIRRARMTPELEGDLRRLLREWPAESLDGYGISAPGVMRVLRVEILASKR